MDNARSPREYNVVQAVYNVLVKADWFNPEHAEACARFVLSQYRDGMDYEVLMALCQREAQQRYRHGH
jgi:hypothetical protein